MVLLFNYLILPVMLVWKKQDKGCSRLPMIQDVARAEFTGVGMVDPVRAEVPLHLRREGKSVVAEELVVDGIPFTRMTNQTKLTTWNFALIYSKLLLILLEHNGQK